MHEPSDGAGRPAGPAAAVGVDPGGRPDHAGRPPVAEAAARAAADVTELMARATGLRRAVELAERSRRESTGAVDG